MRKKFDPRKMKLTPEEQAIEDSIDEHVPVSPEVEEKIRQVLEARKKDAVLNIRVNGNDLKRIKTKARKLGVKYQTFISEFLHKLAS